MTAPQRKKDFDIYSLNNQDVEKIPVECYVILVIVGGSCVAGIVAWLSII